MRKKSKREIYENLLAEHRPTIRSLVLEILRIKIFNLQKGKHPVIPPGAMWVPEEDRLKHLPLKYIALVDKESTVVEVIRINEETADQLLNKSVKLVLFDPKTEIVKRGMWYNKKKFYPKGSNEKKD
jgi:hypothetical protein